MGKTVDLDKLRKRRRMTQTVKRLLLLALIAAGVAGIFFVNSLLVEGDLSARVSDVMESFGGAGYPVDLPGGHVRDMKPLGNNLALLGDTNLYLYNKKGKQTASVQKMNEKTVLLTNDSRALTFETGGRFYRLHTASRTVETELEFGILAGDLGDNNSYALVTAARQFVAEVTVYQNPGDDFVFRWSSPEYHISNVSLSPKGNMMAAACVMTEEGELHSVVNLFHLGVEEIMAKVSFHDSMILHLDFYESDRIGVLTDREYVVMDSMGNRIGSYALDGNPVTGFRSHGREALLMTEYKEARTSQIILLGEDCAVKATRSAGNSIRDIAIGRSRIYVLDDTGIQALDRELNPMEKLEQRGISRMQLLGEVLTYCTAEEICQWER